MVYIKNSLRLNLDLKSNCKPLELLQVPAGRFLMGYTPDSNLHLTDSMFEVEISREYWLSQYLVTQDQWKEVMGDNPSEFKGKNLPVENVDWFQAKSFCMKLNTVYKNIIPKGYEFDLPTEAQWEYACRAGTKTKNYEGNDLRDVLEVSWCLENSQDHTHEVGLKKPNSWEFYDMFGNVFEWCFDMITDYPKDQVTDWIGIDSNKYLGRENIGSRIVRGGSCFSPADSESFDVAARNYVGADARRGWYGFRVCLSPIKLLEE